MLGPLAVLAPYLGDRFEDFLRHPELPLVQPQKHSRQQWGGGLENAVQLAVVLPTHPDFGVHLFEGVSAKCRSFQL